jgi:hypothetical protein
MQTVRSRSSAVPSLNQQEIADLRKVLKTPLKELRGMEQRLRTVVPTVRSRSSAVPSSNQ